MKHLGQKSFNWRLRQKTLWGACLAFWAFSARASQTGPYFPTHHYPTDESFHASYRLGMLSTDSNFVGPLQTDFLSKNAAIKVIRNSFLFEFQPNRRFSAGVDLDIDAVSIGNTTDTASRTGFGDQHFFAEYRFYDSPGFSMGGALVAKFPGYSNPTYTDVTGSSNPLSILMGDAQTDFSMLLTSEYWFSNEIRGRLDVGGTRRLDQFATEVPFLASIGFVTPKLDLELRVRGNSTLSDDAYDGDAAALNAIRKSFGNSDYALSNNPWGVILQPNLELWLSTKWALLFDFDYSLVGNHSAHFSSFSMGLSYRYAQAHLHRKRSFQQVDLSTDQEAGQFQGEKQQEADKVKPTFTQPIQEEPTPQNEEEFQ